MESQLTSPTEQGTMHPMGRPHAFDDDERAKIRAHAIVLLKKEGTAAALAAKLGVSPATVANLLSGEHCSETLGRAVARRAGKPLQVLLSEEAPEVEDPVLRPGRPTLVDIDLSIRVPVDAEMRARVEAAAGGNMAEWGRKAFAEKLKRDEKSKRGR